MTHNLQETYFRQYLEREIPNKYAFIITGTYGTKQIMNQGDRNSFIIFNLNYLKY